MKTNKREEYDRWRKVSKQGLPYLHAIVTILYDQNKSFGLKCWSILLFLNYSS